MGTILLACSRDLDEPSNAVGTNDVNTTQNGASTAAGQAGKETASSTRKFTDYKGHEVEISTSPQRVIFVGETFGDLVALDVNAVGGGFIKDYVFEEQVKNTEDIGFPINLEKALGLNPDLIITGNTDEKEYEQLVKIAPTVMFDTFAPLEERMPLLGDLLGKKQQAENWLTEYHTKAESMWKQLHEEEIEPGETASVFTYYPGDRLFVMARTGLSQVLYDPNGFQPAGMIQDVLDANKGFEQISAELLPEYAGDRIFILNAVDEEAQQSTEELIKSKIWLDLPAVKKGHVYTINIIKASSDASTREWLLEELPRMLKK
ncbi:ABC transporter substrate-binding protein [Paenibacillus profundus]|uniref:ABC transporter substrate-binding protein n=2 Tax=Paenibacillus profundus TaxID=1173085 RepID=A0ABS8YSH2_9BACL|nr:ABC transporter substrate-binding protein [Paenibacillus profundus]